MEIPMQLRNFLYMAVTLIVVCGECMQIHRFYVFWTNTFQPLCYIIPETIMQGINSGRDSVGQSTFFARIEGWFSKINC
jgi:hypothetical protein